MGHPIPSINSAVTALRFFFTLTLDQPDLAQNCVRRDSSAKCASVGLVKTPSAGIHRRVDGDQIEITVACLGDFRPSSASWNSLVSRCGLIRSTLARKLACPGVRIMTMRKQLAAELISMFFGEKRLTIAVLGIIVVSGSSIDFSGLDQLLGGAVLLCGCLDPLVDNLRCSAQPRTS